MKYSIEWTDRAFDQMDRIVRKNPTRTEELGEALREITSRLGAQAETTGESRGGATRVIIVEPLTMYYTVIEQTLVRIQRVRARFTA